MKTSEISITVLESSDGMTLTDGQSYSKKVFLGKLDDVNNWHEVPDEEVPEDFKEPQEGGVVNE